MAVYPWLVIVEPFTCGPSGTPSGYADGTYYSVALNGAGGTGATATIVISGGAVVVNNNGQVSLSAIGSGYSPQSNFTVSLTVGGGSGVTLNCYTGGPTDQSARLSVASGHRHTWHQMMLQRGQADIPLRVNAGDSYYPVIGCQVYLYDQTVEGPYTVFAGSIDQIEETWDGNAGFRVYHLTCVTFESLFDTVLVPPQGFYAEYAGTIINNTSADFPLGLFQQLMVNCPVTLGTIQDGVIVPNLSIGDYPRFSEIMQKLGQQCEPQQVWGIVAAPPGSGSYLPASVVLNFQQLTETASPFTLATTQIDWASMKWEQDRASYRNRQVLQIQLGAFSQSSELFAWSGPPLPAYFSLLRPPDEVTFAWITEGNQSNATGTFSGQPSPGDTITIGYPTSGSIYNWACNTPYALGAIIIDPAGYTQVVTAVNPSGPNGLAYSTACPATTPAGGWHDSPGLTTSDNEVVWTCQGIQLDSTYTFVTQDTLDNTQWGQVVIGSTLADTIANFVAAVRCTQSIVDSPQGTDYSFPTWENPLVNITSAGDVITVRNKPAGAYSAALSKSCANFTWSASETSGGSANNTLALQVAQNGQSATANLYYTPGQVQVSLASLPSGYGSDRSIQIQYTRLGGDVIICENTQDRLARAAIERTGGYYQAFTSDTDQASNSAGLQECQQSLAAWNTVPVSFTFDTYIAGLAVGQLLSIDVTAPCPPDLPGIVNSIEVGNWYVQEVKGELVPLGAVGNVNLETLSGGAMTGAGHYRYTVKVINASQIASWLRFWQDLIGGGGAGGAGGGGGQAGTGSQLFWNTFDIKDTTIGNDVADLQTIRGNATAVRMWALLRDPITADLTVAVRTNNVVIGTLTVPHTTAVMTLVQSTTFVSSPQPVTKDQIVSWDIQASDGSVDPDGVATFTLEYQ